MHRSTLRAPGGLTTSRIEAFTDGVFAIVITLLVLELKVPAIAGGRVAEELPHRLLDLWPTFLSYVISFVVVGVYWIGHHFMFHHIRRTDRALLWLNILFLLCVAFIPFPTALLGEYHSTQLAMVIYGATLIVTGLALFAIWWYATSGHRLVDPDIDSRYVHASTHRILTGPIVYALAVAVSFISVGASLILFALMPLLYILPFTVDRFWDIIHHHNRGQAAATASQAIRTPEEDQALSSRM